MQFHFYGHKTTLFIDIHTRNARRYFWARNDSVWCRQTLATRAPTAEVRVSVISVAHSECRLPATRISRTQTATKRKTATLMLTEFLVMKTAFFCVVQHLTGRKTYSDVLFLGDCRHCRRRRPGAWSNACGQRTNVYTWRAIVYATRQKY